MRKKRWEHFPHQADIGLRGRGDTLAEAFAQAAAALTSVMVDLSDVEAAEPLEVVCEAPDNDQLLVEWLNRIIYEMATRKMLFSRFDVWVGERRLKARIWGEMVNPVRHEPAVEVKAATYHELKVYRDEKGVWVAQCVVDV